MFKAVIFDMNGVIINDEHFHQQGWKWYSRKNNIELTEEDLKKMTGRVASENLRYVHKRDLSPEEEKKAIHERIAYVMKIFKPHLRIMEGLGKFLEELYKNHIPMALATSAAPEYFDFIMGGLNIRKYFKVVITSENVTKGKPDPEIYLKTANKLRVDPKDCIVFEDSISGIKAGQAAGMKVVAIATTHSTKELEIADKVIVSFKDLSIEDL